MNPVNKRIKQVRTVLNMTQKDFSQKICIGQSSLGEIETGVRNVNGRIIQLVSSLFNINKEWILTGNGDMFNKEKSDIRLEHLIEIFKQLDEPLQNYLIEQSELIFKFHNENKVTKK